ncbi:hypothetical protein HFO91_00360 [Rhizobium leguminosarum]|uniref:hypothetical protein n=1 Tax=Rhizobium leguminosarum TaxID=384 RepID=UPI001C939593|nr:hypothetical protein [Rhizobium leguminosarum]MBY5366422.1 hypothetical protein [Rhizobium leguminosarum]MBY5448134.1 hypothetical protein [Rhizobium leguminosarum]
MRSAIYYPRSQVHSRPIMQSSLLLWDKLHTIVPMKHYRPDYLDRQDMAEAWELIGASIVPNDAQRKRMHIDMETTLKAGTLPPDLYYVGQVDQPSDPYEIWPQKLSEQTWDLMRSHRLTDLPLPNGDYPFTQEGGLLVMAKLADACAGSQFARVTDRLMAYGMIGSGDKRSATEAEVVPITLDLIDATSIPIERLIALRKREASERRGSDFTKMRHAYADAVHAHTIALGKALDQFERDEVNRQFKEKMEFDLKDLREALGANKLDLLMKPVVVATVVTGASLASGLGLPVALTAGAAAAAGSEWKDIAKAVADFFSSGFNFNRKQRETMTKHPMAYMYSLSQTH